MTRTVLIGALAAGAVIAAAVPASAQHYYYPQPQPQTRYYYDYGYQQPTYVPPRVARKQAQQSERFVQKYGYVQPAPQYYNGPHYYQPQYQPRVRYHGGYAPYGYRGGAFGAPDGMSSPGGW